MSFINNSVNSNQNNKKGSKKKIIIICVAVFIAIAIFGNLIPKFVDSSDNGASDVNSDSGKKLTTVPGDQAPNGTNLKKTVMLYMDGTDLEENYKNSTRSIDQIIASGVDTENHNILLYTGGCDRWHGYGIPTDKDCIYIIKNGQLQLLKTYEPKNIGRADTLEIFMQYCVTNYPAQQYGLILHDHGGGPNNGVCADFRNKCDMLSMNELQSAFKSVGFGPNSKMEFVFFDACLMASSEVAFAMKDYAHYMVGSENVSYVFGSDYSFIKAIDTYNSGADIGKRYVDCFYNASINLGKSLKMKGNSVYDITYSCIKLSEVDKLEKSIDKLFETANKSYTFSSALATGSRFARGVTEYSDSYGAATDTTYELIDLSDWMLKTPLTDKTLTDNVRTAVNSAVIYNRASTSSMNGLTIYYPKIATRERPYKQFGFSSEYTEYVEQCYTAAKAVTSVAPWTKLDAQAEKGTKSSSLSVSLSSEQAESFASAQYYILAKYKGLDHTFKEDEFILASQGNGCVLNGNVLTAQFDHQVPVVYKADGSSIPFCSPLFLNTTDNGTIYTTYASLNYVPDIKDFPGTRDPEGLNELAWQIENMRLDVAWLTLEKSGDSLDILFGEKTASNGLPSRVLLDPSDYQEISFSNPIRRAEYDANGKLLPVSAWKIDHSLTLEISQKPEDISIKLERLPNEVEYYGVMVLTDIYGNEYTTEILPLN